LGVKNQFNSEYYLENGWGNFIYLFFERGKGNMEVGLRGFQIIFQGLKTNLIILKIEPKPKLGKSLFDFLFFIGRNPAKSLTKHKQKPFY